MHRVALVIHHAKLIEDQLRNGFYAEGKGLYEMALFLQKVLPHDLLSEIQNIARHRNHFAHEVTPTATFNIFAYVKTCCEVQLRLLEMASNLDLVKLRHSVPRYMHPAQFQRLQRDIQESENLKKITHEVAQKKVQVQQMQTRHDGVQNELGALVQRLAALQTNTHAMEKTLSDVHRVEALEKELAEKNVLIAQLLKKAGRPEAKTPTAKPGARRSSSKGKGRPPARGAVKKTSVGTAVKRGRGRPAKTAAKKRGRPAKAR